MRMTGHILIAKLLLASIGLNVLDAFKVTKCWTISSRLCHIQNQIHNEVKSRLTALSAVTDHKIVGLDAPESVIAKSAKEIDEIDEVDYVVIGSGIGGLSAGALLSYYGYSVVVLESHYLPGGVAHTFERDGFHFDAGPSLWNGMATKPYNPLREVRRDCFVSSEFTLQSWRCQ